MKEAIENSIIEWKKDDVSYRLITQNTFEHSARTEFGTIELTAIVKIVLQRKEGLFNFLMTGSMWNTLRVEILSHKELEILGVDLSKYSAVKDEARTVYGMP